MSHVFCKKWWKLNIFPYLIDFLPFLLHILSLYVYDILLNKFRHSMVLRKSNTKVTEKYCRAPVLGSSFLSFKMGCIWKSLLCRESHNCFHFFVVICLIFGLRSIYSIFDFLSGTILRAALANESASLFPWISIWIGIQQNITFLQWFMELSLLRGLLMKGLSCFVFLRGCWTEMESKWITNFSLLLVLTSLRAKSIARISAENMEASFGRRFLKVFSWRTAPHPVLLLLLEPSVKMWLGYLSWMLFTFPW